MIRTQKSLLSTLIICTGLVSCTHSDINSVSTDNDAQVSVVNNAEQLIGTWQVEYISERPVIDYSPAQLIFLVDNKLAGSATCNNISASYRLDNKKSTLTFSPVAMTRKMCPEALMEQELRFTNQLTHVTNYYITNNMLYLTSEQNSTLFIASRVNK